MIRKALLSDAKALFLLESSLFSKEDFGLSLSSFYYHIHKNKLFVYEIEGEIVGYILWLTRRKYLRLYSLGIFKTFQGVGIASKLLEYSLENLKSNIFTLEVKVTNTKAIKLYEKYGFNITNILKSYYPNHLNGYKMVKKR